MKKRYIAIFAALACVLLAGCKILTESNMDFDFDSGGLSKTQKIVITDADGKEKTALTEEAEIDAFVEAVNAEGWKLVELPENAEKAGAFILYQSKTAKAVEKEKDAELIKLCTFTIYNGGTYMTADTEMIDLSIAFAMPRAAAEYLAGLVA